MNKQTKVMLDAVVNSDYLWGELFKLLEKDDFGNDEILKHFSGLLKMEINPKADKYIKALIQFAVNRFLEEVDWDKIFETFVDVVVE
jgi:hypothetical protein